MKFKPALVVLLILMMLSTPALAKIEIGVYGILTEKTHFKYPMSVFVDNESNNMVVADSGHGRILQCLSDGEFIDTFGADIDMYPTKIIRDTGRRIIVCDSKNDTILFFDRKGTFLSKFSSGDDPQISVKEPVSLAVDKVGKFFILDANDCQVKVYEGGGTFLYSIGRKGSLEGELLNPTDIVLDPNGSVYIVDSGNNRISVFDKNGNFTKTFGENELLHPWGISINGSSILVTDTGHHRVVTFSMKGDKTEENGKRGFGNSEFNYPTGIQIDGKGQTWIADSGNNRIVRLKKGSEPMLLGTDSVTMVPGGLTESGGLIYVAEQSSNLVNVYDVESGLFVSSIGLAGTSATGLSRPSDCAFLPRGDLVVSDTGNSRIQIYSTSGEHLVSFCSQGSGAGQLDNPTGLTCTKDGSIIVADTGNKRVAVLSQGGTWDFAITDKLEEPTDCAQDSLGRIWVTDATLGEVLIFSNGGQFIKSLSGADFSRPSSIFIDSFGRVFITDSQLGKIRIFSVAGYELSQYGATGGPNTIENPPFLVEQRGDFFNPTGIFATDSNIFVSDTGNSRIQRIPLRLFGGLPILRVSTSQLSFTKVPLKSSRELFLTISNLGGGIIEGRIKGDQPWIVTKPEVFSDEIEITITADGAKGREGTREGSITIESNGGILTIPVEARFFAGEVKKVEMTVGMNKVKMGTKTMNVSPAPFAQLGTNVIFVPFRFIGEGLGATVTYDGTRVHYLLEGKTLILTLNNNKAMLDGKSIECKTPAYRIGQSVVVPLRFVVENLGGVLKTNGKQLTAEYP